MSIKDILQQAKIQKAAYDRQEELRLLDLTGEEYMLLREDAEQIGVEILQSIAAKIDKPLWKIDSKTRRLCRTSSASTLRSSHLDSAQYSLAITSNSRRFFIKLYRDHEEFDEAILATAKTLLSCVQLIEDEIEARVARKEQVKQNELNAYRSECQQLVDKVNAVLTSEIASFNLAISSAIKLQEKAFEFSKDICQSPDERSVILTKQYQTLYDKDAIVELNGEFLSEIDGVVCKLENYSDYSADLSVSISHIYKCLPAPNFQTLGDVKFQLLDDFLLVTPKIGNDDFVWFVLDGTYALGSPYGLSEKISDKQKFPNGATLMSEHLKIKPYLENLIKKIPSDLERLLKFQLSPLQSVGAECRSTTSDIRKPHLFESGMEGCIDVRSEDYERYLQIWVSNQKEKISTLIWHISQGEGSESSV